jgi:hypothetical protein
MRTDPLPTLPSAAADPTPRAVDRRVPLLLVAAAAYQVLLGLSEGLFDSTLLLQAPLVILLAWVAALAPPRVGKLTARRLAGLGVALLGAQAITLGFTTHYYYYRPVAYSFAAAWPMGATFAAAAVALLRGRARWGLVIAAAVHVAATWWVVRHGMRPIIDVWVFHQDSAAALLRGENPFAITFPNVYGHKNRFYSDEVQVDGRVLFGFPYPPLSLLLYLPSYALTGESRYAHALAYALCAVGIGLVSRRRGALIAAALLLAAPACFIVIESAWTEPFVLLMLVLVALAAVHARRWLPVALGLFFAVKQYNVIFVPCLFLLLPRPVVSRASLRFLGWMALTGAVVSLPLAAWDWPAFWNSDVTIQIKQPFRFDAFSYLALIANSKPGDFVPPGWWSAIPFALLVPTWAVLLWRLPRDVSGFTLGVSVTTIMFLFFNRQAFLNYHTFAAGALLLSVATIEANRRREDEVQPPAPSPGTPGEDGVWV